MTKTSITLQTSSSLNAQIDKAKADHRELTARLPALESERDEALLIDDMPAVEEADRALAAARTQLGRLSERLTLLNKRLPAIVDAEENDAAERLREKAQAVRDAGLALLQTEYVRLASSLAEVLAKLAGAEEFIADANRHIGERTQQVDGINNGLRFRPSHHHVEIAKAWRFSNGWQSDIVHTIDGSKAPPKPDKRALGTLDNDGNWQFEEPILRTWKVQVQDEHSMFLPDLDSVALLPGLKLGDSDFWNEEQRDAAKADFERLTEALLSTDGSPDRPAKRARNALAA